MWSFLLAFTTQFISALVARSDHHWIGTSSYRQCYSSNIPSPEQRRRQWSLSSTFSTALIVAVSATDKAIEAIQQYPAHSRAATATVIDFQYIFYTNHRRDHRYRRGKRYPHQFCRGRTSSIAVRRHLFGKEHSNLPVIPLQSTDSGATTTTVIYF